MDKVTLLFLFFWMASCMHPPQKETVVTQKQNTSPSTQRSNINKPSTFHHANKTLTQVFDKTIQFSLPKPNPYLDTVFLVAAGDVIPHGAVKKTGLLKQDASLKEKADFTPMFKQIAPLIQESDIAFANLETPYRPDTKENVYKSIPYKFNIPLPMLNSLKKIGFNIFSIANNHMYDQGPKAILSTTSILDALGIKHVGSSDSYYGAIRPVIIERKGIKIGFLAFTTWINNDQNQYIPNQADKNNKLAPYINKYDKRLAQKTIQALKQQVDFVVVSTHWGHEYHSTPSFEQKRKAKVFAEAGADLILGHHPHVIQESTFLNQSYVVYSMGNFISNQFFEVRSRHSKNKSSNREGLVYRFALTKTKSGKVEIKTIQYRPIHIYQEMLNKKKYKIYLKQPSKGSEEYKSITDFIGPKTIHVQAFKKQLNSIFQHIQQWQNSL